MLNTVFQIILMVSAVLLIIASIGSKERYEKTLYGALSACLFVIVTVVQILIR